MNTISVTEKNVTPSAEPLDKAYNPANVEDRMYKSWADEGSFHADESVSRPRFTVVIPPPNVTGMLTMGHVLNNTLQDILIRFHRMEGKETLWLPGMDHAGIATQNVVEKALAKEKTSRHDLGREKFLEKVWAWRKNTAASSSASSKSSAARATGNVNGSRWMKAFLWPSASRSCGFIKMD